MLGITCILIPSWNHSIILSTFSLFSQVQKWTQAAEQTISSEYLRSRDVFPRWSATVLTGTVNKHENTI